jgi:glutaredoxin
VARFKFYYEDGKGFKKSEPSIRSLTEQTPFAMKKRAQVIIYTRPGCHLCEEAKREILAARCADEYDLEEVNIDDDPSLKELYGWEIPVVTINGTKAFKYRLTAADFKSKLKRLGRSGQGEPS